MTNDDAADRAARLITHLQSVTQALAAVRQREEVFDIILHEALEALGSIGGTIMLVQGDQLRVAARRGHDEASVWQDGDLGGLGPASDVLRSNTPHFFSESGDLVAAHPDLETHTGGVAAVACAVMPMVEDGRPLGLIVLDFKEPHHFPPDEEVFLITLAGQCALALDRVRLSDHLERQVSGRTAELEAFVGFTELADSETEVLVLAARAGELLSVLFPGCSNGYYMLEGGLWKMKVYSSDLEAQPALLTTIKSGLALDTPIFAQSVRAGEPVFVDGWNAEQGQVAFSEAYQTAAIYPFFVDGTVQAVFVLGLKDTRHWSAHHRAVFRSVGRSLRLALERAEVARRLMAQRDLLQASNEELEALTYSISHDLRTPVRHILSFGSLLRHSLTEPVGEKTERYSSIVETAAQTLNHLLDGILDLSRISRQPLNLVAVDLGRLVEGVCQEVMDTQPARQVTWQVAGLPVVLGDSALLRRVMGTLLSNAVKYTRTREQAVVDIWAEEQPQAWRVLVRDNGVGFDPQYQDKLFTAFQKFHAQDDTEGAGVSLVNARRIVTRHGGTIFAEGQPDVGATFGFTLPKVASH